jgi:hypothetical protein
VGEDTDVHSMRKEADLPRQRAVHQLAGKPGASLIARPFGAVAEKWPLPRILLVSPCLRRLRQPRIFPIFAIASRGLPHDYHLAIECAFALS